MNLNQECVFDIKALTAQEREIVCALRDLQKATQLYELMQNSLNAPFYERLQDDYQ